MPVEAEFLQHQTAAEVPGQRKLQQAYCQEVGKVSVVPTEKGSLLGIYTEVRSYSTRTYLAVIYDQNAQEFIVKNLEAIVNGEIIE